MSQTHEQKLLAKGWKRRANGYSHPEFTGDMSFHEAIFLQSRKEVKENISKNKQTYFKQALESIDQMSTFTFQRSPRTDTGI